MSLGRLCSNSLISSATTTSRNLTSATRGCKIVCKRVFFFRPRLGGLPHLPGVPHPPCKQALTLVIPSVSNGRNESLQRIFFHYLRHNEHSIDFFERSGKRFTQESPKIRSWRWCAVFYWSEKWSAWKMGSQPRRAAANTESLSLWQTCWSLRPWQDERKGLYLIQWCFSWTLKLWLQFSWSLLTFVFLFFFQVTSRYYWVRLLEDWNFQALRPLPAYFKASKRLPSYAWLK